MKIGDKTHALIVNDIAELLNEHATDIDTAYKKFGEKKFAISFKCELNPGRHGGIDTTTKIKFAPEPDIENDRKGHVDEEQLALGFGQQGKATVVMLPRNRVGRMNLWR
jgi:hypothetical protein